MTQPTNPPGDVLTRIALTNLRTVWNIPTLPPLADDQDDDTNGCDCGGWADNPDPDDDYDRVPVCTCGDGCGCPRCMHDRHAQTRVCHHVLARDGRKYTWCGQPTRFVVRPFCVHRTGVVRSASNGDPAAGEHGKIALGGSIQWHPPLYACTTQHARALIDDDQAHRAEWSTLSTGRSVLSAANTYYQVDPYVYEPDHYEVPAALSVITTYLSEALHSAKSAMSAHVDADPDRVRNHVDGIRRYLMYTLQRLQDYNRETTRADAEFDTYVRQTSDDIVTTLAQAVDVEAGLARIKTGQRHACNPAAEAGPAASASGEADHG